MSRPDCYKLCQHGECRGHADDDDRVMCHFCTHFCQECELIRWQDFLERVHGSQEVIE